MRRATAFFVVVLLLQSCVAGRGNARVEKDRQNAGQLSIFFSTKKSNLPLFFTLDKVQIERDDGRKLDLEGVFLAADAAGLSRKELFLWEGWLPAGEYRSLILHIGGAHLVKDNRKRTLMLSREPAFPIKLGLQRGKNSTLFLEWDPDNSIKTGYLFDPAISIRAHRAAPSTLLLYTSDRGGDNITLINKVNGTVIDKILVGAEPQGMAITSDGNTIYVANSGERTITVIDAPTRSIINRLRLKTNVKPLDLSISSDNNTLYAVNRFPSQLVAVAAANGDLIAEVTLGEYPTNIAISPSGDRIFVSSSRTDTISIIDAAGMRLVKTLNTGTSPQGMAFNERGDRLFVSNKGSGTISVIELSRLTVVDTFRVGVRPAEIAHDRIFNRLYIVDEGTGSLLTFDLLMGAVISSKHIPGGPIDVEIDEGLRRAYVLSSDGSLIIINLPSEKIAKTIWVGKNPYEIALPSTRSLR